MELDKNGEIRITAPNSDSDRKWLKEQWSQWGGDTVVSKGKKYHVQDLDALIAWVDDRRVGEATYRLDMQDGELLSLNATVQGIGVGSHLIATVEKQMKQSGRNRIWVVTTNDNVDALKFYQRLGYRISAVKVNAIDEYRKLKPTIPQLGNYDIPIRDEIVLEKNL